MTGWNMPHGVSPSDIPGNGPEEDVAEKPRANVMDDVRALRACVRALEKLDERARCAAVHYLYARYIPRYVADPRRTK